MASVNRVQILGRLGAEPELKYTPQGRAVCHIRIATDESYKDKAGKKIERAEWHRVVIWGPMAETCAKYLSKGREVFVDGKLATRSWEKDGERRSMTEVVANDVQFLGSPAGGSAARDNPGNAGHERSSSWGADDAPGSDGGDVPF